MPLVYDNTRTAKQGGGWIERPDVSAWATTELPQLRGAAAQRYQDSKNRWNTFGKIATSAAMAPFAAIAAPALMGGGAAAGGGIGAQVVPAAGKFTLGNLLKFAEIGVPAVTNVLGMRSQNKALDKQAALEQQNLTTQMQFAREQEAIRKAEYDRQMAEEMRRFDIDQQNRQRELASAEEDRAFNRRLIEEKEARKQHARMRLQQFLGMGR